MIFSTDRCPLCGSNLSLSILESSQPGKVGFTYNCPTKVEVRNLADTGVVDLRHYENLIYSENEMCFMIFPPFELLHMSKWHTTSVRKVSALEPKKLIFETTLLDWDYSKTQDVLRRLKTLVTFS